MTIYIVNFFLHPTKLGAKAIHWTISFLLLVCSAQVFANNDQVKAVWYRYYDNKGVANVSSSITPSHIRYGYEALDRNMQVIKRTQSYNAEQDQRQAVNRAIQAQQRETDNRLKRAYSNSSIATSKRNEQLLGIKKQIAIQQQQLQQLQNDRLIFKRQEMDYYRKGNPVPAALKDRLKNNEININNTKKSIQSLHNSYQATQTNYDQIIKRLKTME